MDWKLNQQRRKKNASLNSELTQRVNILDEMERDFSQIFGGNVDAGYGFSRRQAGDPVRRSESFGQSKNAKAD